MCGFVGVWGEIDDTSARTMLARLAHRGPDGEAWGRDVGGTSFLGHRRLSIVDLEGGTQPIVAADGQGAVVANGEVYNHQALRRELDATSPFRTRSDSEAILHVMRERGTQGAAALRGMFAFVVTDGARALVARDPLGIKPLYVGRRGEALCFASELQALVGLADDVRPFPPGHVLDTAVGEAIPYWQVPAPAPEARTPAEWAAETLRVLEVSVVERLMADVPVGAFLSGGLDSSLVAALMRRHVRELHTFSVGLRDSPDLAAARHMADFLGTIHHEHVLEADEVRAALPAIVSRLESFDQDLVRSAVPCWFVSRLAREHVKVVLTGEGADELFAGYAYHRGLAPDVLGDELRLLQGRLHEVNLQRVDRMTMAHGLEARVPFLSVETVELAARIPVGLKLRREGQRPIEKWVLRLAAEGLLPREVLWRPKEQFDVGTGAGGLLGAIVAPAGGAEARAAAAWASRHPTARLSSLEEACYHAWLTEGSPDPALTERHVARWAQRIGAAAP